MIIFGITGTLGAGKGTIVKFLEEKGFRHYSVREFLIEEITRRGMPVNRDSMNTVGEGLRAEHGASYVIDTLYQRAEEMGENAIIESIRTVGEVTSLKQKGGTLIAVDADPHIRYERAVARGSATDKVSFEKFIADEERESRGNDPARMNLRAVAALADYSFINNGSIEELHQSLEKTLTIS